MQYVVEVLEGERDGFEEMWFALEETAVSIGSEDLQGAEEDEVGKRCTPGFFEADRCADRPSFGLTDR